MCCGRGEAGEVLHVCRVPVGAIFQVATAAPNCSTEPHLLVCGGLCRIRRDSLRQPTEPRRLQPQGRYSSTGGNTDGQALPTTPRRADPRSTPRCGEHPPPAFERLSSTPAIPGVGDKCVDASGGLSQNDSHGRNVSAFGDASSAEHHSGLRGKVPAANADAADWAIALQAQPLITQARAAIRNVLFVSAYRRFWRRGESHR